MYKVLIKLSGFCVGTQEIYQRPTDSNVESVLYNRTYIWSNRLWKKLSNQFS